MNVIHLSAECYPVAKVGGLGDVVGALPKYLCKSGINASVVIPYYDRKFVKENSFNFEFKSCVSLKTKTIHYNILKEKSAKLGFNLYLIHVVGLLDRPEIYGYPDEIEQFIAFQICFLDWILKSKKKVDIIHCHDHHAGLIPFLITQSLNFKSLSKIPTVCTIHNAEYQGCFGWDKINLLPEFNHQKSGLLDWSNCINSLASAIKCCWKFTSVSPNYLKQLAHQSNGLEKLFKMEKAKGIGILNGIDTQVWDPQSDSLIFKNYSLETVNAGKKENKALLCKSFNLSSKLPLIVFIGRLVPEKGADLLPHFISNSLNIFKGKLNFIVLGSGEVSTEEELSKILIKHHKHYGLFIGYNEELAHRMYAAADFLLMPSRVEPCGLNQLYALKYGTIVIYHETGGLKDSLIDLKKQKGYAIKLKKLSREAFLEAIKRALTLYQNKRQWTDIRTKIMGLNFSWDRSCKKYIKLYKSLIGR
jgi:starch synthase